MEGEVTGAPTRRPPNRGHRLSPHHRWDAELFDALTHFGSEKDRLTHFGNEKDRLVCSQAGAELCVWQEYAACDTSHQAGLVLNATTTPPRPTVITVRPRRTASDGRRGAVAVSECARRRLARAMRVRAPAGRVTRSDQWREEVSERWHHVPRESVHASAFTKFE